jgi:hypothetical protein
MLDDMGYPSLEETIAEELLIFLFLLPICNLILNELIYFLVNRPLWTKSNEILRYFLIPFLE